MTRVLRSGVDGLTTIDLDQPDRCPVCETDVPPLSGVAWHGGIAHPHCVGPAPRCAICDREEGDTEWGRFVRLGDGVAHAGCRDDRERDRADTYEALHS